ncbi:hypothetical protein [Halorientalis halophila]|uniref:hypothetical protein n=1 Tax=Halorientalis halophila TaxID=3108499 RepID=UPI0030087C0A
MEALANDVWDELYERVQHDLRAVVRFTPTDYDGQLRSDVAETYDSDERERIIDETIIRQLGLTGEESDMKVGELSAFVRQFDRAWVISWREPDDVKSGFFVSIQRDGYDATMADVEYCIQYLNEEIEPRL